MPTSVACWIASLRLSMLSPLVASASASSNFFFSLVPGLLLFFELGNPRRSPLQKFLSDSSLFRPLNCSFQGSYVFSTFRALQFTLGAFLYLLFLLFLKSCFCLFLLYALSLCFS